MENQELFNTMMENAIVYLQGKGLLPKSVDLEEAELERENKRITKMLQDQGLLPRK